MLQSLFSEISTMAAGAVNSETVNETVNEAANAFNFQPGEFLANLKYMAAGMVGIFLVIGTIILTIVVLGKLTSRKKKKGGEEQDA